VENVTGLKC